MPAMQRFGERRVVGALLLLGAMSFAATPGFAAAGAGEAGPAFASSSIAGVVRDAQGVVQMGALVQILAADSVTVAMVFTDQQGRYSIPHLMPGHYMVRASATLFAPTNRQVMQLRTGSTAVVNLTLSALFETASWLPANRRKSDEADDDWKWTLRSAAKRPILRMVEDGATLEVSSSASEQPEAMRIHTREAVESGDGGFGRGGVHSILSMHHNLDDGSDLMVRADLGAPASVAGSSNVYGAGRSSTEMEIGLESRTGFTGGAARTVVSYKSHPELMSATSSFGGPGLQVMEITSGQRFTLGERIEVQAGGRLEAVHAVGYAVATHPFLRVVAHPAGMWALEYRLATERGLQSFDDVTSPDGEIPVALGVDGHLALESGRHQEFAASRRSERGTIEMAIYHDRFDRTQVAGGLANMSSDKASADISSAPTPLREIPGGMLLDVGTGSFRALATGYGSNGLRFTASSPLTSTIWVAAEYSLGDALVSPFIEDEPQGLGDALHSLKARRTQTATIALKGRVLGTGTRVRASYRWEPVRGVTAVDPYSAFGDQAYLSCLLRQPIRWSGHLPRGLDATVDVTNLLAQGYRPFLSDDGQTLYFAQSPRTIQAGLSFNF